MANLDGVFRREWGPAVAALARWSGDLTVAEDAVQEAFAEALRAWPRDGVPDNPGGWVLTVARNRARDRLRRESVRPGKELAAVVDEHPGAHRCVDVHPVRDDELRMMFTCAHPALDRLSQLALTLRLVSGLTVAEIARALLQTEAAVGQRITRAKTKVRHANIPLRVPPAELLPERTPHVLSCIYSVFTEGYWSTAGPSAIRDELCDEGVRLAGELCTLMPAELEAHALAALVLLHDSRRATRVDADGALVPLEEQDRRRWDRGRIARGLDRLRLAHGSTGPYLPQAVIAALHATAPSWEQTDWRTICTAYDTAGGDDGFAGGAGQPGPGGGFPRRPGRRTGRVGEGGPRPAAGPVQPGGVGARRSAAARRTARRCPHLVSNGVGVQRFRAGPRLPAPAHRRVRRINRRLVTPRRSCG